MGTFPALPAAGKFILGLIPAILVTLFAGLIGLIGLALSKDRREYALAMAETYVRLAAVLVGVEPPPKQARPRKQRGELPSASASGEDPAARP